MVRRTITGAHYGLKDWLVQRVTAAVMAVFSIFFVIRAWVICPSDYIGWVAIFEPSWMRIVTLLFFLSLFWHAWIGVRDIYMDYVKCTALRLGLQVVTILLLAAYSLWAIQILWGF
ncbi:MAG: succinate dehydrogenase, hydrophobic membrane anchor protein [Burkholderiales bacterium]